MTALVATGRELYEAAAWAARLVPAKPAAPVLAGLLLDARDDQLRLTATDWETWASVTVPATVKEPGRLLLNARLLVEVAKCNARDVDVEFDDSGGPVMAQCGKSKWSLPALPVDDFPMSPTARRTVAEVDAVAFRAAVGRVVTAAAIDGKKPALAGVRIEPSTAGLTLVASDSYRVHAADVPLESGKAPEALIPAELLKIAVRHAAPGTLGLSCKGGLFGVASDEFRLTGRQIDAEFPRWRHLVPERSEHRAVVEVAELSRVVDHVQVMAAEAMAAAITLQFDGETVEATALLDDRSARAEAPCTVHGEPMSVILTPAYLREALAALPSAYATVQIEKSKCLLLPCDAQGVVVDGVTALVMGRKR